MVEAPLGPSLRRRRWQVSLTVTIPTRPATTMAMAMAGIATGTEAEADAETVAIAAPTATAASTMDAELDAGVASWPDAVTVPTDPAMGAITTTKITSAVAGWGDGRAGEITTQVMATEGAG